MRQHFFHHDLQLDVVGRRGALDRLSVSVQHVSDTARLRDFSHLFPSTHRYEQAVQCLRDIRTEQTTHADMADGFMQNGRLDIGDRFVTRSKHVHMSDTIPLLHQILGLAALAVLALYLFLRRRRKIRERLDYLALNVPEFLRNPKLGEDSPGCRDVDLSLDIHPWGGRPRRPPPKDPR